MKRGNKKYGETEYTYKQTSGLPESCHTGYNVTAIPSHSFIAEPVCQITYEN
jgi:hypothetical protein